MGLIDRLKSNQISDKSPLPSDKETDAAHEILEIVGRKVQVVRPSRVIFASFAVLLMLGAMFVIGNWIIPYNKTSIDVVYLQGGPGHVVLVEIDNQGSRSIEDVSFDMRFLDESGLEIVRSTYYTDEIPAHTSIAGDELELLIEGSSVWENYTIELTLEYTYRSDTYNERFTHDVGQWTMELFTDKTPLRFF